MKNKVIQLRVDDETMKVINKASKLKNIPMATYARILIVEDARQFLKENREVTE